MENSYLNLDGLYYAMSSSESEDPAAGLPYYQRVRILRRQINPIVELKVEGEAPETLPLTLRLLSWAKNADGAGNADYDASGFAKLDGQKQVNLFEVFSKAEDKARLRHFVLAELSWDKAAITGSNSYTLEVGEIPGFSALVEGDVVSGFSVSLTKLP